MSYFRMLVSNLDGTLLGDDDALQSFIQWRRSTVRNFRLVYASGQSIVEVQQNLDRSALPPPDAIIGGLGSEISLNPGPVLESWPSVEAGSWSNKIVRQILEPFEELVLRPMVSQSAWKVSYYAESLVPRRLAAITEALHVGQVSARIFYDSCRELDVLPRGVDKGAAARWLADHWDIPPCRVIACGDNGNDLPLFEQGFMGVIVENATTELREMLGAGIYRARMGFAAGVVEGMSYWA